MSQVIAQIYTHEVDIHNTAIHDDFWMRFKKNLSIELLAAFTLFWFLVRLVVISIMASFPWFYNFIVGFLKEISEEFPEVIGVFIRLLGFFVLSVVIYVIGTYFTLLPPYIVFPLLVLPKKIAFLIVGLAMVISFFIVFLI